MTTQFRSHPSLTAAGPATILLTMGELEITDSVKLSGPGSELLTIDAQSKSRIINITEAKANVSISDLSFINGKTTGSVPNEKDFTHSGGAIRSVSTEDLIVHRTSIRDSGTQGSEARGGGLFAVGNVTLFQSVIMGNDAGAFGGGVASLGTVSLEQTTVSGNTRRSRRRWNSREQCHRRRQPDHRQRRIGYHVFGRWPACGW